MGNPQGPTFLELLRQSLTSTEKGYDMLAPKFEHTSFRTPDWLLENVRAHIGKPNSIDSAIDICCGTGAGVRMLRPLCRDRVVGIDLSNGMLDKARELAENMNGTAKVEFLKYNALDVPFVSEFDLAVSFSAFGHILAKDASTFLDQVAKVLKPGGRFVTVSWYKPSMWSKFFWFMLIFNVLMFIRNLLIRPKFIMYWQRWYRLPELVENLKNHGFTVELRDTELTPEYRRLKADFKIVIATKKR